MSKQILKTNIYPLEIKVKPHNKITTHLSIFVFN